MKRIVVGIHDSLPSRWALRWAAGRAVADDCLLDVVTAVLAPAVVCPMPPMVGFLDRREHERSVSSWQATMVRDTLADFVVRPIVVSRVVVGTPAAVLATSASDADLLVLGARVRRAAACRPFRPLARHCMGLVGCPVVQVDALMSTAC